MYGQTFKKQCILSEEKWGRVVSKILELINSIFNRKELILDDRIEFRVNKKEKQLIKKYCDLRHITASEFFRNLAMKEIDKFIKINR